MVWYLIKSKDNFTFTLHKPIYLCNIDVVFVIGSRNGMLKFIFINLAVHSVKRLTVHFLNAYP
jgi:hypothetical protein